MPTERSVTMNDQEKERGNASKEDWLSLPPVQDVFIYNVFPLLDSFDLLTVNKTISKLADSAKEIVVKREQRLKWSIVDAITSTVTNIHALPSINTSITVIATWRRQNHFVELVRLSDSVCVGRLQLREPDPPLSIKFQGDDKYLMAIYRHKITLVYIDFEASEDGRAQKAYRLEEGPSFHWVVEPKWDDGWHYGDYHFRGPYCLFACISPQHQLVSSMLLSFENVNGSEYLRMGVIESAAELEITNIPLFSISKVPNFEAADHGVLIPCPEVELTDTRKSKGTNARTSQVSYLPTKLFTLFLKMRGFRGPYSAVDISCGPTRILFKAGFLGSDAAYIINPTFEFGGPWLKRYETEDRHFGKLYQVEFVLLKSHVSVARVQSHKDTVIRLQLFKCADGSFISQVRLNISERVDLLNVLYAQEDRLAIVVYGKDEASCCSIFGWGIVHLTEGTRSLIKVNEQLTGSFYKTFAISPDGQLLCFVHLKNSSSSFCTVSIMFTATGNVFHRWDVPVVLNEAEFHGLEWMSPQGSCGFKIVFTTKEDGTIIASVQANNEDTFLMYSKIFRAPISDNVRL